MKETDYIVVHVTTTDKQYWTGSAWTADVHQAKRYAKYGDVIGVIWRELPGPGEPGAPSDGKYTTVPYAVMVELLADLKSV